MRLSSRNWALVSILLLALALPSCDFFDDDNNDSPTEPRLPNVVLLGSASTQANAQGLAEYLGQVVNTGSVTARNVRVSVNVFDGASNLIDVATSTSVPADLPVQATGTFKVTTSTPLAQAIAFEVVIQWD